MAIEGGCRWIQLSRHSMEDDVEALKANALELIPVCKESDAFLVIEDDVDMVNDLKVHGVVLRDSSRTSVLDARERLGAHAVIGVWASSVDAILDLKGVDVDYVLVNADTHMDGLPEDTIAARFQYLRNRMNEVGVDMHLVAYGDFTTEAMPELLAAGCAGVAVSGAIARAENPVEATSALLSALEEARSGLYGL